MSRLTRIEAEVTDLTDDSALLKSKEFLELFKNPRRYEMAVALVLADPTIVETRKHIAVLGMQTLPLPEFLSFGRSTLALVEEGRLESSTFERAIFPGYAWNTTLAENYHDEGVRGFLMEIKASRRLNARVLDLANGVLVGQAHRDVEALRKEGMLGWHSTAEWYRFLGTASRILPIVLACVAVSSVVVVLPRRRRKALVDDGLESHT